MTITGCMRVIACVGAAMLGLLEASAARAQNSDDAWLAIPRRAHPPAPRSSPSVTPAPAPQRTTRIVREVLALYDSAQEPAADRTRIHRYLELPLNHLGLTVTYWDIAGGMPDADLVKRHRAVVTWFSDSVGDPAAYLDWASRQAAQSTRFVILESVGSSLKADDLPKVNALMKNLGIEVGSRWVGTNEAGGIVSRDAAMLDYESKLGDELPGFMVMEAKGGAVKSHLVVQSKASRVAPQARSSVVVTGPGGGFAALGYVRRYDGASNRLSWVIDPFSFLTAALGLEQGPVPDTTTVSGRRIYFSHIDGDGWSAASTASQDGPTAAEAVMAELIAPYADLPVSVGLIGGDADLVTGGLETAARTARKIFELPQVEVASHTNTNPFTWSFFESYDRERELGRIAARRATALRRAASEAKVLARFAARDYAMQVERAFIGYGRGMPRASMQFPFDLESEVNGALATAKQLAPAEKPVALYQWSGDSRPFEAAVRATRQAGVRNLNGGEARLDAEFPSIMNLPPIGRPVGRERQIYAVNSNENSYTNGWRGPFDGQAALTATWDNTDAPRRLKGMNLTYHMYTGSRADSVAAVKHLLDGVRAKPTSPISAATYAAIADSFYEVETGRLAQLKWRVANRGALQTVRFDDAGSLWVDMRQSHGVLGFTHHGAALYVALDEAVSEAIVALTASRPEPKRQERPYLVDSRWQISRLKINTCGFDAHVKGYGAGEMTWSGVRPGHYVASLVSDRSDIEVLAEAGVDQSGELRVTLKGNAIAGATLKVACARTSPIRTGTVTR